MRALSASELLTLWERGHEQTPADRDLALLRAACGDVGGDEVAGMSIGQRDAGLLKLREQIFGPDLAAEAACPACGERLELDFRVADVLAVPFQEPSARNSSRSWSFEEGEVRVEFRLPTAGDVVMAAGLEDASAARSFFLDRCLLSVQIAGRKETASALPDRIAGALIERMAQLDPQAETRLSMRCPACGHEWRMLLDIGLFFWAEIQAWARRMLWEVHTLASAYGWREDEILALSPRRRRMYLEMAAG